MPLPPTNLDRVVLSQPLEHGAGTAALPVVTSTPDTTTGIYFPAVGQIGYAISGVQGGQVDSGGIANLGDWRLGNITAGGALGTRQKLKLVSAIADNVATDILTITVPNTTVAARIVVTVVTYLGAGGAVGAGEATAIYSRSFAINRFPGAACVVAASTATNSTSALSSGAATNTTTLAATAMTGAVGVAQTFTIQVTIARGSGSSTNHVCACDSTLFNVITGGPTFA